MALSLDLATISLMCVCCTRAVSWRVCAATDISMRNIKQHGFFLMKSSTHLLCPAAFRDMSWVAIWVCLSLIAVCAIFFVQKLFSVGSRIRPNALFGAYGAIQLIVLCSTTLFIYVTPISPPAAAMLLMWVVVVMMKLHSYVATNYSMHQEYVLWGCVVAFTVHSAGVHLTCSMMA